MTETPLIISMTQTKQEPEQHHQITDVNMPHTMNESTKNVIELEKQDENNACFIRLPNKKKLPNAIKENIKQSFGCHWNEDKKMFSSPMKNKILVEACLKKNEIEFSLEDGHDEFFSLDPIQQRQVRLESAKKFTEIKGIEKIRYLQSLIDDYNKTYSEKLKINDFKNTLKQDSSNLEGKKKDHFEILFDEYKKIEDKRDQIEGISNKINELNDKTNTQKENKNKTSNNQSKEKEQIFKPLNFDELLSMPPKEWLLDPVFGAGDVGMIFGQPGCGKTFVVIDMILQLCTGNQWANRFEVKRELNVAYCAGEGISGLPSRFKAAAKHYNINKLHNLEFYKTSPQLFSDDMESIGNFISERKDLQRKGEVEALDVLVIDTLHTATAQADENSAKDMGVVLLAIRAATKELGCAVILVHHTNKGGTAERGSSSLRGAVDFMIEISKPSETGTNATMICSKLKDGEAWKSQNFDLIPIEDCNSVFVKWGAPSDIIQPSGSQAKDMQTLQDVMNHYTGKKLTCKTLSESIAQSEPHTRKLLNALEKENKCKKELFNPCKPLSNKNSWVYWV